MRNFNANANSLAPLAAIVDFQFSISTFRPSNDCRSRRQEALTLTLLAVIATLASFLPSSLNAQTTGVQFMAAMSDLDDEEKRLNEAAAGVGAGNARPVPGEMGGRNRDLAFQGIELLGVRMTGYPVGTVLPNSHPLKNQMDALNDQLAGPRKDRNDAERKASALEPALRNLSSETEKLRNQVKGLEKRIDDLGKSVDREQDPARKRDILQEWQAAQTQAGEARSNLDKTARELAKVEAQKAGEVARIKDAEGRIAPLNGQMNAVGEQIASEEAKRIDAWLKSPPISPGGGQ